MKSPLKDKPLRNPGESLEREIQDLKFESILFYFLIALFCVYMAVMEWYSFYFSLPRQPWTYSAIAAVAVIGATIKIYSGIKKLRQLRQGQDGEKAVGQFLERLRENGARVFHDVPGQKFNLDHVVIAKSGIYVVETKTYSKPDKGDAVVVFDGSQIWLNGYSTKDPVIQVRAAASWLKNLLRESTGRELPVIPVVVFPGWFVEPTAQSKASEVWVLNPKVLPSFIANSKEQLGEENLNMAAFHLTRYVRTYKEM